MILESLCMTADNLRTLRDGEDVVYVAEGYNIMEGDLIECYGTDGVLALRAVVVWAELDGDGMRFALRRWAEPG